MVLNRVVLPTPFGPITPTMPLRGRLKDRPSISTRSPKPFFSFVDLDDDRAQTRARRDLDLLEVELAGAVGLGGHLLVALQAGLVLGLPGLGAGAHPLELDLEPLGELGVLLAGDRQALALLLQVGGVVALVGVQPAAVDLGDPLRDVVEEVAIVGDGEDGAGVGRQELLQPLDTLGVQVVGGLVEQQQVGLGQQQPAQRDPAALTTGEHADVGVAGRAAQRVHGLVDLGVEIPGVGVVELLLQLAHLGEQLVGVLGLHLGEDLRCSGRSWR